MKQPETNKYSLPVYVAEQGTPVGDLTPFIKEFISRLSLNDK